MGGPLYPAKCRIKDEASKLDTQDVILYCLVWRGGWSNDGRVINRRKSINLGEKPAPMPLKKEWYLHFPGIEPEALQ
jgi:hypothetical protein